MSSFEYQNSTISKYRAGTIDDPYIDITESKKVINNTIQLNEVPAFLNKVQIDNYVEIPNMSLDELEKNEYRVDYSEAIVHFHSVAEGEVLTLKYKGRGNHFISSSRIWTQEQNGEVIETLQNFVDKGTDVVKKIDELTQLKEDVEQSLQSIEDKIVIIDQKTQFAESQGNYASTKAIYAEEQGSYAKEQGDLTRSKVNEIDEIIVNANDIIVVANKAAIDASNVVIEANQATARANNAVSHADTQADYAEMQGNFSKLEGNYAREMGDEALASKLLADAASEQAKQARDNAEKATQEAINIINQTNEARDQANSSAANADEKATFAESQGIYAKAVGDSLMHKGEFNTFLSYEVRNIVSYHGSSYMCITSTSLGKAPTDQIYWRKLTSFNWRGVFSDSANYAYGDYVVDPDNHALYMCKQNGSLGFALSNEEHWQMVIDISSIVKNANDAIDLANNAVSLANSAKENSDAVLVDANNAIFQANLARDEAIVSAEQAVQAASHANTVANETNHLGIYDNTLTYKPNNMVSYNGSTYMCIVQSENHDPTEEAYWRLLAIKGSNGAGTVASIESSSRDLKISGAESNPDLAINENLKNLWNDKYTKEEVDAKFVTYTHTQTEGSTFWNIEHNLNRHPSVIVVDSEGYQFQPTRVRYVSENVITVVFTTNETGKAYLN